MNNLQNNRTNFRDVVVRKPWGYEFLVYESDEVALWLLHITEGSETSLHCHPKKTTGLLLLQGEAELHFLADSKRILAPAKQMLRRGLFHRTRAVSKGGLYMLEIETPNDKDDLVRLFDDYGRSSRGYESASNFTPRSREHVWITEPISETNLHYTYRECQFSVHQISHLGQFESFSHSDILMFLRGGIGKQIDGRNHLATIPGDIGVGSIIQRVAKEMNYVDAATLVLRVGNSEK